ncbi:MAG: tetratricopeptide repeat protein [Acidobacteria bacterium]|nr:tetratricopeptide repeat protein [Acidobacteriota bacterium]
MSTRFARQRTRDVVSWCVIAVGTVTVVLLHSTCALPPAPAPPVPPGLQEADPGLVALVTEALVAVRAAPREADTWGRLARVYDANGFTDAARRAYEQAVALDPSQPRWWYRLAVSRADLGDVAGGIEAAIHAANLDPHYAPAEWRRGQWLLELGDLPRSVTSFERATQADPGDPAGWLGLTASLAARTKYVRPSRPARASAAGVNRYGMIPGATSCGTTVVDSRRISRTPRSAWRPAT